MAPSSTSAPSSAGSSANGDDFPPKLAASLPQLRQQDTEDDSKAQQSDKGGLGEPSDLAANSQSSADAAAKLEQKRLEHNRQRELQKKAFEEQMKQLELQQQAEEQALLAASGGSPAPSSNGGSSKPNGPVRSRSGNDLAGFGAAAAASSGSMAAKSMPGSRRHSGELKDGKEDKEGQGAAGAAGRRVQVADKEGKPMLNSFLFDDELDADLQNSAWGGKYLQMNTDDDKFPVLIRRGDGSGPGVLSASSAALDLAPLSQTPSRGADWPASFATGAQPTVSSGPVSTPATPNAGINGAASPRPIGGGKPSDRSGSVGPGGIKANGMGSIDALNDQFSNFNLDTKAFSPSASSDVVNPLAAPFLGGGSGGYVHDPNAFVYDGAGASGAFGSGSDRNSGGMGANRFAGLRLEDLQGDMLPLCKDQFGCRYLQKKLEDGNPEHRDMIFNEIFPHFAELMTDPFANYLAQRLLEYATDEQRDALIESIAGELVSISLNMHGTRAVQKMIDFLSTQRQVQSLILALNLHVVTLIKDLNGNHVIQKCLNHLPPEDNQFIYNAVATHCIEVATHRHGCCVLQRCIDHASESQRIQLVTEITYNSLTLVQDAFGNYVVQYVLDLNDNRFIEAIVRQFLGNVSALSAQKFSSNVVEKCIRVADGTGRRAIIDELLVKQRLERLLRDSFANYVVQTALDYAEPAQRAQLIETIRPILPMIRNTPYGKRIQSKIQRETHDGMRHGGGGGYHGHYGMPAGGHFYGMGPPIHHAPPQYMSPHPGMHGGPPPMGGEYGGRASPYVGMNGYPAPPPPHGGPSPAYGQPPHHHQQQNGGSFTPFPGQDYAQGPPPPAGHGSNAYPQYM
ncbi:uncharacterized protein JCM6883_006222 [Sporobolomyces salmoneus]|uniref:uncharacterized protein n=1 Tax=Sporobolomyces salmoneus TaxID=183962 RepID=UPI00316F480D